MVSAFAMEVEEGFHPPASSFFDCFLLVSLAQVAFLLSLPQLYFFFFSGGKTTCCVNAGDVSLQRMMMVGC